MPRKKPFDPSAAVLRQVQVADATRVNIDLKWAVFLVGVLVTTAMSAGAIVYQINAMDKAATKLEAKAEKLSEQQRDLDMKLKELAVTLRNKGVIQ